MVHAVASRAFDEAVIHCNQLLIFMRRIEMREPTGVALSGRIAYLGAGENGLAHLQVRAFGGGPLRN